MIIKQTPISDNHLNAMFFDGIIAMCNYHILATYQTGEFEFEGKIYVADDIIDLAKEGKLNDVYIDNHDDNIHVDKFFAVYLNGEIVDEDKLLFSGDYNEAIEWFKKLDY